MVNFGFTACFFWNILGEIPLAGTFTSWRCFLVLKLAGSASAAGSLVFNSTQLYDVRFPPVSLMVPLERILSGSVFTCSFAWGTSGA